MSVRFRSITFILAAVAGLAFEAPAAQPTLTQIQDIIYKADGTPFQGVAFIEWRSFITAGGSNIGMHTATVNIVNGVLKVKLAPTTNAVGGAYYFVKYNSNGRIAFTEAWSVPPSTQTLKLADVRSEIPNGTSTSSTQSLGIDDITGLATQLALRPTKGPGYTLSRAAMINATGGLESVMGAPDDCVHTDGTSGPCATTGTPAFVDNQVPLGIVDGSNATFTLGSTPSPPASLALYRNGLLLSAGADYGLNGTAITFQAAVVPQPGDLLVATYRTSGASLISAPSLGQSVQVLCSATGGTTMSTTDAILGSCTIADGTLLVGDRIEVRADWAHAGTQSGFAVWVKWGATTALSRAASQSETMLSSQTDFGIGNNIVNWSSNSWGASTAQAAGAGSLSAATRVASTITMGGSLSGGGTDTVTLRNYTVLRYPAQTNP